MNNKINKIIADLAKLNIKVYPKGNGIYSVWHIGDKKGFDYNERELYHLHKVSFKRKTRKPTASSPKCHTGPGGIQCGCCTKKICIQQILNA